MSSGPRNRLISTLDKIAAISPNMRSHYLNSCWSIPRVQYTSAYMWHQREMSQLAHFTKVWRWRSYYVITDHWGRGTQTLVIRSFHLSRSDTKFQFSNFTCTLVNTNLWHMLWHTSRIWNDVGRFAMGDHIQYRIIENWSRGSTHWLKQIAWGCV